MTTQALPVRAGSRAASRQRPGAGSGPAVGAGAAQLAQAAGSFALQIAAAHALGASGLGVVSLCLGIMILTTAVTSGVVGDSLTVLDRYDGAIRGALEGWALVLSLGGASVSAGALALTGVLSGGEAAAFFLATVAFQWEELLRRVLMARMRFWTLLVIDGTAVAATVAALVGAASQGPLDVRLFLVAVAAGQSAGLCCAVLLLAPEDRRVVPLRGAAFRQVIGFGGWRGIQVAVTPLGLTASRVVVLAGAGTAALGAVEGARIIAAPALLVVQGLGSYLLAAFAREQHRGLGELRARARSASVRMTGAALVLGGVLTVAAVLVGDLVVGSRVDLQAWTVVGWVAFAAAVATMQPFAVLAVTRGLQWEVLALRCVDALTGIGLLALLLLVLSAPAAVTPYALAVGPLVGGLLVRRLLLPDRTPTPEEATA